MCSSNPYCSRVNCTSNRTLLLEKILRKYSSQNPKPKPKTKTKQKKKIQFHHDWLFFFLLVIFSPPQQLLFIYPNLISPLRFISNGYPVNSDLRIPAFIRLCFVSSHELISYIIDWDTITVELIAYSLVQYYVSFKNF